MVFSFILPAALIILGIFFIRFGKRLTAEILAKWQTKIGRRIDFLGFAKTRLFLYWNRVGLIVLGAGFIMAGILKLAEIFVMR